MIDGQDVSDVTIKSLRDSISYCPQNHYFFNDTFLNNLKFSHIDKYFDVKYPDNLKKQGDEYIEYICKNDSELESFQIEKEIFDLVNDFDLLKLVENNPGKWNFMVGDNADKLSGGQKQRLNLIRSFLRETDIYLFDEPTNFLDSINKQVVICL